MHRCSHRAFTLSSLVAILVSTAVLSSLLVVTVGIGAAPQPQDDDSKLLQRLRNMREMAKARKDGVQLRQLHIACLNHAAQDKRQRYLRPGLVWRLPINGQVIIGQGPERNDVNTTASFYSAMVAENYFSPDILISPIETNAVVKEDFDYDYSAISPVNAVFWDPAFTADLDGKECNTSYAHLAICGKRKAIRWRDGTRTATNEPVFANRGIRDGVTEGDDYVKSPTLRFIKPHDRWVGNIVYNDNHTERHETPLVPAVSYEPRNSDAGLMKDNIFAAEFGEGDSGPKSGGAAADTWLIIAAKASADGHTCTAAWDALLK